MTVALAHPEAHAHETASAVRAIDLSKSYDDRAVLAQVNLDVTPGRFLALLGANGAGKSTLLRVLATLIPPTQGELHLFGQRVRPGAAALRARIGLIGHQPILYRDLTLLENLTFFGKLYGLADAGDRALQLLEQMQLAGRADDTVKTLSRGMTQRVSIARALMHDPPLLLADEPFAGLDAPSVRRLEGLLVELSEQGKTIVLSNHDVSQSLRLAQQALVLRHGRVVIDRPTSRLEADTVLKEIEPS